MGSSGGTRPVRLLHLSDIHFRGSKTWDARPVLRQLIDFIAHTVDAEGPPDLVAITGDLAYSGKASEYKLAREWLDQLWARLGSPARDRLLLVPGNHDVDRSKVDFAAKAVQASLLSGHDQQAIATVLGDRRQCAIVLKRHAAYTKFVGDWFGAAQPAPWWRRTIPIDGIQLHVAGLDSAWMACSDDDSTRLLIGRYQLTETVETDAARDAAWRLALVHHPWDDLAAFDRSSQDSVHRHCDLLLRGHLHQPRPQLISQPDRARTCLELPTGCAYGGSEWANAFQWIELSPPPAKRVRIRFCLWNEGSWIIDKNRGDDGWWQVEFAPPSSPASARIESSSRPEVSADYIEYIRRAFGRIALLGAKEGRAVTLSHVYVPALTRRVAEPSTEQAGDAALPRHSPDKEQPAITLLERLDGDSLYVPAPAGAGKSTFCHWAALQCVAGADAAHPVPPPEEFAEPEPANLRGRLPVFVPLRDFSQRMECGRGELRWNRADLERRLAAWIESSPPDGLAGADLLAHLKAGSTLLLLDGLDEVAVAEERDTITVHPRTLLLTGLADALPTWRKAGNRVLLTSRPYGLEVGQVHTLGLPVAELDPLPEELQSLLVRRWFNALGKDDKIDELIATVRGRDDLQPLAENPMLLTAICVLYDNDGRLPEDRYDLYKNIVAGVLHNRYAADARERDPVERRLEAIALGMHEGDENEPRRTPAAEVGWHEVEGWLARFAQLNPVYETDRVEVGRRREELLNRSGLLLPRAGDRAAFYHLSIQEFLAAQRLARSADDIEQVFRDRRVVPEWRGTLLFLFAAQIAQRDAQWALRLLGRLLEDQDRAAVEACPVAVAFVAEALDLCLTKQYAVPADLGARFRSLAEAAIEDEVEIKSRHAIGLCLGRLGDPRIRSLRDAEAYVEVPAGIYPYGENGETFKLEAPFRIGRYPVTNSQFAEFIAVGGYREEGRRWWSEDGWRWLQEGNVAEPRFWRDRRWNGPNQPVVGVSFWEAEACCAWAGGRLPREREWEAAARGPAGLQYPWGNDSADGICNTGAAGLGGTSPVGLFPRARQALFHIEDLAGNVWEWCDSFYDRSDKHFPEARVLRGGSWRGDLESARSAFRGRYHPFYRDYNIGFRVVSSSPIFVP